MIKPRIIRAIKNAMAPLGLNSSEGRFIGILSAVVVLSIISILEWFNVSQAKLLAAIWKRNDIENGRI